ncbi:universal stress protein [Duganella violaceipulchra]|uniref:Nucleotide-binding universal stress UspA family protein n=1 Tax=Duganella violaceipulchra TaxID=2849652 RepID=A0AA41HE41_9BURK|nr:universal stress protein [Duganella violaceicalia]MBV6323327.1 universal stress protein [Duganella violaceicalia]MCP2007722.1 nucleotide-binding universal stress UspA family protein [Duganella violaceicalia]
MFKHFLMPTDGSAISTAILRPCIQFAKECGASITAVHVIPEFHVLTYQVEMLEATREQFRQDSIAHAQRYLAEIEQCARELGVPCKTLALHHEQPYEAIIQSAREQGCDLICMASHGRRGVKGMLLGSETQKVLTHSQIPVLVFR